MLTFEDGLAALKRLAADEITSEGRGRNEATTRLQIIDRLLFECLGWERSDCISEERFDGKYADYSLAAPLRALILEAKREGEYFELPAGQLVHSPQLPIAYFKRTNEAAYAAISQCIDYCTSRGTNFGAVCNGHQLIAFLGSRLDGTPPLEGRAIVFDSVEQMIARFQLLWNVASKSGVQAQGLSRELSEMVAPPPPVKLAQHVSGYPGYRVRNTHQTDLQILGDVIIEDAVRATRNEAEFLEGTYCPSGALSQYALVSKTILETRYAALEQQTAGPSLVPATTKKGVDPDLLAHVVSRRPVLLVGDVGVGKTMFVRHLIRIEAKDLLEHAIVLYLDFGTQPTLSRDLAPFVAREVTRQLREEHRVDVEEAVFVRGVYHAELLRFEKGIFGALKQSDPPEYGRRELDYLASLVANAEEHIKRSLEHLEKARRQQIVVFLDNVDQRPDEFQQEVFLVGVGIAATWPATVFISLRPETFYRSRASGALSGYHARAFTIAPPRLDQVIKRRLEFAVQIAESGRLDRLEGVTLTVPTVATYLGVLLESFEKNPDLLEFCENMCGGNIRLGLDFIRTFIGSGHVDTAKILGVQGRGGNYLVPRHEFIRAVIYGDYQYFDPSRSPILNVFDITMPDPKEHFLVLLLLAQCEALGRSQPEGYGKVADLYRFAQDLGYLPAQIHAALARALLGKLVERPDRSTEGFSTERRDGELTHVRVTTVGAYYARKLSRMFVYLDAVVVDTPITDASLRSSISGSDSISERLDRLESFVDYLDSCWAPLGKGAQIFDWPRAGRSARKEADTIRLSSGAPFRLPTS
ncbi:MAG: hypothetical protein E6J23_11415 [Chloroflexi bacterium]|nr:MAG: hypothetical protein E6J23_11415 [Chloroflexota bacterium]